MTRSRLTLACGAQLDDLTRQVFEGTEPGDFRHQTACPYCRDALAQIRTVSEDVHTVAALPVAVPPSLLRRVMARLRTTPSLVTVTVGEAGMTEVAESVVARVAREAALAVSGVTFASALSQGGSASGAPGLRIRLVVAFGPPLHGLADTVRDSVRRSTARYTGVQVDQIDVCIDDLA